MNFTAAAPGAKKRDARVFFPRPGIAAIAILVALSTIAECFCPLPTTKTTIPRVATPPPRCHGGAASFGVPRSFRRRFGCDDNRRSVAVVVNAGPERSASLESSSLARSEEEEEEPGDADSATGASLVVHQKIRDADPQWYQEYVTGILGGDFCTNKWPDIDLPVVESLEAVAEVEAEESIPMATTLRPSSSSEKENDETVGESESLSLESTAPPESAKMVTAAAPTTNEADEKQKETDNNPGAEEGGAVSAQTDGNQESSVSPVVSETVEAVDDSRNDEEATTRVSTCDKIEGVPKTIEFKTEEPSNEPEDNDDIVFNAINEKETTESTVGVGDETASETSAAEKPSTEKTRDTPATDEAATTESSIPETTTATPATTPAATDPRALVYRSITGNAMTCVPLANLTDLGYTVGELERIQAEFLSIVVLDKRKCPSMGIPTLWKIRDPKAEPEVTIVGTMVEASAMVYRINEEEREKRDSLTRRRQRQDERRRGASSSKTDGRKRRPPGREEPERGGRAGNAGRNDRARRPDPRKRPRGDPAEDGDERRRDRRRQRKGAAEETGGRPRNPRERRRRRTNGDGNPRKIYSVPRGERLTPSKEDPPDPNSPIWVNMDTFRDLLQKEADFRMKFVGDDWAETIEQENDWRTGLYQQWLWSLNNGVGGSIVPPSRYERARRNQGRRVPRRNEDAAPKKRRPSRRRRDPEAPPEPPRRRPREEQGESPPPPRRKSQQQQRRSRPLREQPRDPFEDENDSDGDPERSAKQRRSRRRAERSRGQPRDGN